MDSAVTLDVAPEALHGRDIVCFSNDWTGDPLSKTHLMRLLARDNRILWVNSIGLRRPALSQADFGRLWRKAAAATQQQLREVERNIFLLNPLAVPFHGQGWAQAVNRRWLGLQVRRAMRALDFQRAINWVFNPAAGVVAGQLGEESVIYYCVDEFTAMAGVPTQSLLRLEHHLLARADLVIVSAERLRERKGAHNPRTVLVRHGVQFDHFQSALDPATEIPAEIADLPRPVLGYFGLMSEDWLDVDLLVQVAQRFSHGSLVLLGKVAMDLGPLRSLPNVHILGRKPFDQLPAYCRGFDVGLNPMPLNEVTLHANPLKAREYLAAGLPVISTAIPEVEVLPHARVARTTDEFIEHITAALTDPTPREVRSASIRHESWADRLTEIRQHCADL